MNAIVRYSSVPDKSAGHAVADSAAPVLVSAKYYCGGTINDTVNAKDTLKLVFSEPLGTLLPQISFKALATKSLTPYSIAVNTTILSTTGVNRNFLVNSITGVPAPTKGDSIWIDPASNVSDIGNVVQLNPNNNRVAFDVVPAPYSWAVQFSKNPFVPGQATTMQGISAVGIVIKIVPTTKITMDTSATGRIYDLMGNLIMEKTPFHNNVIIWDGRNRNNRYVGTGTYLAIVTAMNNGILSTQKYRIGVKR